MIFISNTFSPMMLSKGVSAKVEERELERIKLVLECCKVTSVVSHEVTSLILSGLLGTDIKFNRINLSLQVGDILLVVIPNFRAEVAREFTYEEVKTAGYRCFVVNAYMTEGGIK